eukprot:TRINITY_DN8483_c0_g1_i1.p1 TRINITY_DN8483_c0_g1~~TRINITY_DN8483_c0_g1_i1.p1  ORF type:complete len:657 (+),score=105.95 TRINITY_DN8483_c0_g1_i1:86-2056(+)
MTQSSIMLALLLFAAANGVLIPYSCKICPTGGLETEQNGTQAAECETSCSGDAACMGASYNQAAKTCAKYGACDANDLEDDTSMPCEWISWVHIADTLSPTADPNITTKYIDDIVEITMSSPSGSVIYYTLDGVDPVAGGNTTLVYQGPFVLSRDTAVKAATFDGSFIATVHIVILERTLPPTYTPQGGESTTVTPVTLSTLTDGATVYYRTCPGQSCISPLQDLSHKDVKKYVKDIPVYLTVGTWTMTAVAILDGLKPSVLINETYIVYQKCPKPVVVPGQGRYQVAIHGTVTSEPVGTVVKYTVIKEGSPPAAQQVYSTVKGMVIEGIGNYSVTFVSEKTNWLPSDPLTVIYVLVGTPPQLMVRIPVETNSGGKGVVHVDWYEQHIASILNIPVERVLIEKVIKDNASDSTMLLKTSFALAKSVDKQAVSSETLSSLFLALPDTTLEDNNIKAVWLEGEPAPPIPSSSDDHSDVIIIVLVLVAVACICCVLLWVCLSGKQNGKKDDQGYISEEVEEEAYNPPPYMSLAPPPPMESGYGSGADDKRENEGDRAVKDNKSGGDTTPSTPGKIEVLEERKPPTPPQTVWYEPQAEVINPLHQQYPSSVARSFMGAEPFPPVEPYPFSPNISYTPYDAAASQRAPLSPQQMQSIFTKI